MQIETDSKSHLAASETIQFVKEKKNEFEVSALEREVTASVKVGRRCWREHWCARCGNVDMEMSLYRRRKNKSRGD